VRVSPPTCGQLDFIPLYHYLYHECTLVHGMMNIGPDPYALPIRNAWNAVWGQIPGAVLTGDGTLLNRETWNWAEWEPKVGSNDDALEMIRTITAMRRGAGRDALVYGRLQRPPQLEVETVTWDFEGRRHAVPAVAHAAWQTPDGRRAIVLANWSTTEQPLVIGEPGVRGPCVLHTWARQYTVSRQAAGDVELRATLLPLSCALLIEA
jgi:hypothetical protein